MPYFSIFMSNLIWRNMQLDDHTELTWSSNPWLNHWLCAVIKQILHQRLHVILYTNFTWITAWSNIEMLLEAKTWLNILLAFIRSTMSENNATIIMYRTNCSTNCLPDGNVTSKNHCYHTAIWLGNHQNSTSCNPKHITAGVNICDCIYHTAHINEISSYIIMVFLQYYDATSRSHEICFTVIQITGRTENCIQMLTNQRGTFNVDFAWCVYNSCIMAVGMTFSD